MEWWWWWWWISFIGIAVSVDISIYYMKSLAIFKIFKIFNGGQPGQQ